MPERQLLIDTVLFNPSKKMIEESLSKNNGVLKVKGVVQRANALNQNNRFYPKHILEREVEKYQTLIKERRALSELDHPDSSVINLKNVSHLITELYWDGDDLIGEIEILSTPSGNILKSLFQSNVCVGISSRGLGSTKDIGGGNVQVEEDFEIICFDAVSNPSTQGAFLFPVHEGIIKESKMPSKNTKYDRVNRIIMDIITEINQ